MHRDTTFPANISSGTVTEPERQLPIRDDYDVVVCGGGPAGCGAALASAREGARTLLIEKQGTPGGVWTAGIMNPFFECLQRGYIVQELIDNLQRAGAWRKWFFSYTFDVEKMTLVLEEMFNAAGVDLLYYTLVTNTIMDNDTVGGVIIESKAGREALTARVVIDTTGDGDVAALAGCRYELGRITDSLLQPMTLMFEIRGAQDYPEMKSAAPLYDQMAEAISSNNLDFKMPIERANYAPWIIHTPATGSAAVQLTHAYKMNSLDPQDLTRATTECRKQAHGAAEVLKHIPGLEDCELIRTAPHIGVREARRIRGGYYMELADLAAGRRFEDAVASCAFVVDIHNPDPESKPQAGEDPRSRPYEIPYRCLVPEDCRGLLVAGRCISGSHEAHASYRVTGTAMALGQAAGLAAAKAVRNRIDVAKIDGKALHDDLSLRGAQFLDSTISRS